MEAVDSTEKPRVPSTLFIGQCSCTVDEYSVWDQVDLC